MKIMGDYLPMRGRLMRDDFWSNFTTVNKDGKVIRDGEAFEDLIEALLRAMFGTSWEPTRRSHDHNRDFHIRINELKLWAECKNYEKKIALDTVAPTLVMAQVFDVDSILFFSYSEINPSAKRKILAFGEKSGKRIFFYDELKLERLLIQHRHIMPDKYRISLSDGIDENEYVQLYCSPFAATGAVLGEDAFVAYHSFKHVSFDQTFSLVFFLENPSSTLAADVAISLSSYSEADRGFFRFLGCEPDAETGLMQAKRLRAGESAAISLNLVPVVFRSRVTLPSFVVHFAFNTVDKQNRTWHSERHALSCCWKKETALLGSSYQRILKDVIDTIRTTRGFTWTMIAGTSGTGKSRLLTELVKEYLALNYKVIELTGGENYASSFLIKEIIAFVFEIPSSDVMDLLRSKTAVPNDQRPHSEALALFNLIDEHPNESDLMNFIIERGHLLFEMLATQKIALVVDNIQHTGKAFQRFLSNYALYATNKQSGSCSTMLCACNRDYMTDDVRDLLFNLNDLPRSQRAVFEIEGFENEKQAELFLRELLYLSETDAASDMLIHEIIRKASLNPFYLSQTVEMLYQNDALRTTPSGRGYLVESTKALNIIDSLRGEMSEMFDRRFARMARSILRDRLYRIFSALYLFGNIDDQLAAALSIERAELLHLRNASFLKEDDSSFSFFHDILRAHFEQTKREHRLDSLIWLKLNGGPAPIKHYEDLYSLYQISIKKDPDFIWETAHRLANITVSSRIAPFFFEELHARALETFAYPSDKNLAIAALNELGLKIKQYAGHHQAETSFQKACRVIESRITNVYDAYLKSYRHLLYSYCEILVEGHDRVKAQKVYQDLLDKAAKAHPVSEEDEDELHMLQAFVNNRWYVIYNDAKPSLETALIRAKRMSTSRAFIPLLRDMKQRETLRYLNDSDEGYQYYGYRRDEKRLLELWEACVDGMPQRAPEKTMNYHRKRVQLALIKEDQKRCTSYIDEGRDCLKAEGRGDDLVFMTFFLMADVACHLQGASKGRSQKIEHDLFKLMEIQKLYANRKLLDVLQLKGIYAFYRGASDETYYSFVEAFKTIQEKPQSKYWIKRVLLMQNIRYSFTSLGIYQAGYDVSFLPRTHQTSMTAIELETHIAKGILRTRDGYMNLPLV